MPRYPSQDNNGRANEAELLSWIELKLCADWTVCELFAAVLKL